MTAKKLIKKIVFFVAVVVIGGGMVTLLIAANHKQQGHVCREVQITIKGDGEQFFIDKDDILKQLKAAAKGPVVSQPMGRVNLAKLELSLEKGLWIRDAQLYFDSREVLHVVVTEREPVARIFTKNGMSFYIDSSGQQMPLLQKETARVLVVTNFTGAKKYNRSDSAMAADVKKIANAINNDDFWIEQIGQLDITPNGMYEAIPIIGNHTIRFGTADNIENKLSKLFIFYKQVLSKTGFDKYETIDLQYEGQVIGILPGQASAIDSVQLQKNISDLLLKSNLQMNQDSVIQYGKPFTLNDSLQIRSVSHADTIQSNPLKQTTGNGKPKPATTTTRDQPGMNKPRAVMPSRQ
jgi:cell division protein FtsQ